MLAAIVNGAPAPSGLVVPLDFTPASLAWCPLSRVLYVVDPERGRVLTWQRSRELAVIATLAGRRRGASTIGWGAHAALGQIALGVDGEVWVASTPGVIHRIPRAGPTTHIPVDPSRVRRGLCVTRAGAVFSTYTLGEASAHSGALAQVLANGLELDAAAGLEAPAAVVEIDEVLLVADRARGRIFRAPATRASFFTSLAAIEAPVALSPGANGALWVGTELGEVAEVDRRGTILRRMGGLGPVRGVAYDAAGRLFVAEVGVGLRIVEGVG